MGAVFFLFHFGVAATLLLQPIFQDKKVTKEEKKTIIVKPKLYDANF